MEKVKPPRESKVSLDLLRFTRAPEVV